MKCGTRALGVAVSAGGRSDADPPAPATVAAAVVRADRVVDGLSFSTCTVGGIDATAAVVDCIRRLGRPDARHVLLAGVAPAWFNLIDCCRVHEAIDRPVVAISFEASAGLEPHLREHFAGEALDRRLAVYESLPEREPIRLDSPDDQTGDRAGDDGPELWMRRIGVDTAAARRVVAAHTPEDQGRPEPLRVARLAARAGRSCHSRERGHEAGSGVGHGGGPGPNDGRDG